MKRRIVYERLVKRGEDDGSFDREFWQRAGAEARFAAAWEMVAEAELFRGNDGSECRLDKSVENLKYNGKR